MERLGVKGVIFTIDVGWWSKRTLEARISDFKLPDTSLGAFMASGGLQDRNLSWHDIAWIRVSGLSIPMPIDSCSGHYADYRQRQTKLPIIMKGVQSVEDVELCVKYGAQGIMLVSATIVHMFLSLVSIDLLRFLSVKSRRSPTGLRSSTH